MLVTKCACQATSMMKRTFIRVASFAPQNVSTTNKRLLDNSLTALAFRSAHASSVQGLLSFLYSSEVHHTESSLASFFTKNLSLGERPV